jgi:putative phosphoribosyl transferase
VTFRDRGEAGRLLARRLRGLKPRRPVVLGLPRGGIPVAAMVARALGAPLDVLVVRKLGCPWQPELGFGAIGEEGVRILNDALVRALRLSSAEIAEVEARERAELERRVVRYRGDRPPVELQGRTVIVVDDGVATGSTARAAVELVRRRGAGHVIVAVPVASTHAAHELASMADEVVCLESSEAFGAIGEFYDDFTQTSDEQVAAALAGTASPSPA